MGVILQIESIDKQPKYVSNARAVNNAIKCATRIRQIRILHDWSGSDADRRIRIWKGNRPTPTSQAEKYLKNNIGVYLVEQHGFFYIVLG